jgi:hypothetical protein
MKAQLRYDRGWKVSTWRSPRERMHVHQHRDHGSTSAHTTQPHAHTHHTHSLTHSLLTHPHTRTTHSHTHTLTHRDHTRTQHTTHAHTCTHITHSFTHTDAATPTNFYARGWVVRVHARVPVEVVHHAAVVHLQNWRPSIDWRPTATTTAASSVITCAVPCKELKQAERGVLAVG